MKVLVYILGQFIFGASCAALGAGKISFWPYMILCAVSGLIIGISNLLTPNSHD